MSKKPFIWRVELFTFDYCVNAFEEALDPFCDSITWFETNKDGRWCIEGISLNEPDEPNVFRALDVVATEFNISMPDVVISTMEQRDWIADGLKSTKRIFIGRFLIHGTNNNLPKPISHTPILLNPGRAFGSGEHESTMGCLFAINDLAKKKKFKKPLDMGCGSGILSIAIAKTWHIGVRSCDVDYKAVLATQNNSRQNCVHPMVRSSLSNGYISRLIKKFAPYDLIVCNIFANALCEMAKSLRQVSGKYFDRNAIVVLSGFLDRDLNRVYWAHHVQGFKLIRTYHIKGWCTVVLKR